MYVYNEDVFDLKCFMITQSEVCMSLSGSWLLDKLYIYTTKYTTLCLCVNRPHPLCSSVLMLKPRVGEIVLMSSPLNFFRIVVFPALSRPLKSSRLRTTVDRHQHTHGIPHKQHVILVIGGITFPAFILMITSCFKITISIQRFP